MPDHKRLPIRPSAWVALTLAGALLQACAEKPAPAVSAPQPRLFASDFQGAAKNCAAPKVTPEPGKVVQAAMKVGNDGGWCAMSVNHGGEPYATGLLTQRPVHGKVYIHPVGNDTRIDYTPDAGFSGDDSFVVTLLPGRPAIDVAATVTPQ